MTIYRTELLPHVGRAVLYDQPARTLYAMGCLGHPIPSSDKPRIDNTKADSTETFVLWL